MRTGQKIFIYSQDKDIFVYGIIVGTAGESIEIRSILSNDKYIDPGSKIISMMNNVYVPREAIKIVFENL